MIRQLKLFFLFLFSGLISSATTLSPANVFKKAEKLYKTEKYKEAVDQYQLLLNKGYNGKELFYNLGNCYYKLDEVGKSILYYEKALKLDPSDEDLKVNLALANTKVSDKLNEIDKGLGAWFKKVEFMMPADKFTFLGLLLWIGGFIGFLFSGIGILKKFKGINYFLVSLGAILLLFGYLQYRILWNGSNAVILEGTVRVKSTPDENSKDVYILHEGTKVNLHQITLDWYEISIDNENFGWVRVSEAEVI